MKCSNCGATALPGPTGHAPRCLNCGTPLGGARSAGQGAATGAKHAYATPHGKLIAQIQKSGSWVAAGCIQAPDGKQEAAATLVKNLLAAWHELDHPALPKLHGFDPQGLRCTWVLPDSAGMVPLSSLGTPLEPAEVRKLVLALERPLECLHRAGLAAFDLSPSTIFVRPGMDRVILVPTPWLASLANWSPGRAGRMPCVAPELDQAQQQYPDPVRADVYAVGALTWLLLTGRERKAEPTRLPGESSPELAPWDSYIDGCCRSNPARRFASAGEGARSLKAPEDRDQGFIPSRGGSSEKDGVIPTARYPIDLDLSSDRGLPSTPSPHRLRRSILLVVAAIACVYLYGRRAQIVDRIPGARGLLQQVASHVPAAQKILPTGGRGFGDTVLTYKDRDYENSSWKKLQETDSLSTIASFRDSSRSTVILHGVTGWDEDSFWITGSVEGATSGLVFRFRRGHWSFQGEVESSGWQETRQRLLDEDTILFATGPYLYELSPRGTVDLGKHPSNNEPSAQSGELCPIAPDLYYLFLTEGKGFVSKVASGKRTEMNADKYKEAFVHRKDNTPLKDYRVEWIKHTRSPAPGKAIGVHPGHWGGYYSPKLVSYQDGIWHEVDDLPKRQINDVWLEGPAESPNFLIAVGEDGYVYSYNFLGPKSEQSVTSEQERTSLKMIKAWGVGGDKFWVMDSSGTVWQRQANEWRVVVRGMYRDDVKFKNAWVSPNGTVIAVTQKQVYRLD